MNDLRKEYEADLAVNPRAYKEWWQANDENGEKGWEFFQTPITDWEWKNLDIRRSPSAPDRDEWLAQHIQKGYFTESTGLDIPQDKCATCPYHPDNKGEGYRRES